MAEAGVPLTEIGQVLRHKSLESTANSAIREQTPRPNAERLRMPTSHSPRTPCRTGPRTRPCSAGSTRWGDDPSPGGLCGLQHEPRRPCQRKHHGRARNPAVYLMSLMANSA
jgi:hypothetical protein